MNTLDAETRLRVLAATGLLDSAPERGFDRLTRLAAALLHAPVALVSLVDGQRQFFKSALGLKEPWATRRETPIDYSFCKYAVEERSPFVVNDAREHPVLRDNRAISELSVVAYAGIPLIVENEAIGAFCVLDDRPRAWQRDELSVLQDLAESVVSEIELRMALRSAVDQRALTDALIESLGDGVLAMDANQKFLIANQAARRVFTAKAGMAVPEDWATEHRARRTDGSPLTSEEGALVRAMRGENTDGLVFMLQAPDVPEPSWLSATGRPVRDESGKVIAGVAVYRDVTQVMQHATSAQRLQQVQHALIHNLPNGALFMVDQNLRFVAADGPLQEAALARTGFTNLIGHTVEEAVAHENRDEVLDLYRGVLRGETRRREMLVGKRYLEASGVPILDGERRVTHALVMLYDVTGRRIEAEDLRHTRDLLARERTLLGTTLEHIKDGVVLLDEKRSILLCNAAYAEMFAFPRGTVLEGLPKEQFFAHVATLVDHPEAVLARLERRREGNEEYVFARPRRRVLRRSQISLTLPSGPCFLVTWQDVTSERDLLAERERQLLIDGLTGIANRRAVEAALRIEDARRKRTHGALSVALFDVDHFKRVNDLHGHAAGDEVLRGVAASLAREARLTDLVARWGGEEFLAILPGPLDGGVAFCERARQAVERLRVGDVTGVTISAGVAELTDGESAEDAIARADQRLYEAKHSGRNRVVS